MRLAALVLVVTPTAAAAAEEDCPGRYGVGHPLPDRCLGLIDTDRPHQTDTPHVVPAGHAQFESAIASVAVVRAPELTATVPLFENAYKVGLASGVDAQLIFKHAEVGPHGWLAPGPLNARVKLNFIAERGAIPAVTFVPWLMVPFAPDEALRVGPHFFWGWELPRVDIEMNAGVFFGAPPARRVSARLATAVTVTLVDRLRAFVDVQAIGPDVGLGTGLLYPIGRDMQIDLGSYVRLHGDLPIATPFVGYSLRR